MAAEIPEFGGAFFDKGHVLNIYLTDLSASSSAKGVTQSIWARSRKSSPSVRVLKGNYSYSYLVTLKAPMYRFMGPTAVVAIGIDDRNNRVLVWVASEAARATVLAAIREAKLPEDAFRIEQHAAIKVTTTRSLGDPKCVPSLVV